MILRKFLNIPSKIMGGVLNYVYHLKFKECGKNFYADKSLKLHGCDRIYIGNNVCVQEYTWLAAVPWTGCQNCQLRIDDNATLGAFNHIYATGKITIEHDALTANSVYITDNLHQYENIVIPIKKQPIKQLNEVIIGEGCWIGEHAAIIGASIGKHSVIGANAVVTHNIPDYCVAVGSPAYIIKRYNPETSVWEKTDKQGNFISNHL